ncbi:MAG: hypothetical protein OXT72_08705 [Gammaproteobacteria bacterium]|nr:hypothetical protein [Gammaproteobacteria bacterium]MDE0248453.1 hypothetical protein [Gammaproteobacteria bacterium]
MNPPAAASPIFDVHSHLVPRVDDGARSLEAVRDGVGRMVERGVRTIVTTPHLNGSMTRSRGYLEDFLGRVDEAYGDARREVRDAFPGIRFLRGHEVSLDAADPDLSDARIRLAGSDAVLVEWPYLRVPSSGTLSILRSLRSQGVRPLVAHPERYRGYRGRLELPGAWREEGAFLQVNYGSLAGRYGRRARAIAARLLSSGLVDCLATDFHCRPHLRLYIRAAHAAFRLRGAEEAWTLLTATNPERICRGEDPLPMPPLEWNGEHPDP